MRKEESRRINDINHLARWASNRRIYLARGTAPLAQVFKLINNS